MHFSAKCNSGRIAIQWFHIKHYLGYQYTKFQPYTFRVQKNCVFARYATLVPRLKRVYGSLCFKIHPQQMSQSKKKYMDLCQHAYKYKQVVFGTIS